MTEAIKIGISGAADSGKTPVVKSTIKLLEEDGFKIGGVMLDPVIEDGKKVGYDIVDVYRNKRERVSDRGVEGKHMVEDFSIDVGVLNDVGIPALTNNLYDIDVIVIDEIGKITAESKAFMKNVMEILDEEIHILMTMDKRSRSTYLQDIRSRTDFRVLEVTAINRAILPHKVSRFYMDSPKFSTRID